MAKAAKPASNSGNDDDVEMESKSAAEQSDGDDEQMDVEEHSDAEDEELDEKLQKLKLEERDVYSLEVLKLVKQAQQARGLRHGDYVRYRQYCTRRLHRIRNSLKFVQGTKTRYHGKSLKPENINDPRFLQIPLFMTERSWSYGMELKQENKSSRKKFHMLRRLNKAAKSAAQLARICQAVKTDARTKLEVEAYSEWMRGVFHFHKEQWKEAVESLSHSQIIYEKIASTLDEDTKVLYKQRIEETLPQIRYCAYNIGDESAVEDLIKMRLSGNSGMGDDVMAKLDDLIAQNRAKQSESEISWLGKTIPVKNGKVRVLLMSAEELGAELEKMELVDEKLEVLENMSNVLREALQIVQEELKNVSKDIAQQNLAAVTGTISGVQLLHSYVTVLKNQRSSQRALLTIQIMKGQAKLSPQKSADEEKKKHKPQDFIRLYDTVVENNVESAALPGVVGTSLMETTNAENLLYKAYRALYIGSAFVGVKKFAEAITFFDRALDFANQAEKTMKNADKNQFEDLRNAVAKNKDSAYAFMVLAKEEFADVEQEISHRHKKKATGELDLPLAKPFTFDLVLDSIKLPNLDDRIAAKKRKAEKPATTKVKDDKADTKAEVKSEAAAGGLGGAIKGLFGFGRKN